MELAGESGQKCLAVQGVRRGEGRFCDLSDSGEARRFISRHFRDLGVNVISTLIPYMSSPLGSINPNQVPIKTKTQLDPREGDWGADTKILWSKIQVDSERKDIK